MTNPNRPASVLVTDDESNIRLMVRSALETDGYAVTEAADGRAALEAVRRDQPDLMILDLNMPVLDGMAVLEQMKAVAGRRPRVVVLTAYGSIPTAVRATRLGAADFLEKPVLPDDVRRCVRGVLDEQVPPTPPAPTDQYTAALDRVRRSLRLMDLSEAETVLAARHHPPRAAGGGPPEPARRPLREPTPLAAGPAVLRQGDRRRPRVRAGHDQLPPGRPGPPHRPVRPAGVPRRRAGRRVVRRRRPPG